MHTRLFNPLSAMVAIWHHIIVSFRVVLVSQEQLAIGRLNTVKLKLSAAQLHHQLTPELSLENSRQTSHHGIITY